MRSLGYCLRVIDEYEREMCLNDPENRGCRDIVLIMAWRCSDNIRRYEAWKSGIGATPLSNLRFF
jgi:hypothetical protein